MLDHRSLSSLFSRFEQSLERFARLAFSGAHAPGKFGDALDRTNKQLGAVSTTAASLQTNFAQLQQSSANLASVLANLTANTNPTGGKGGAAGVIAKITSFPNNQSDQNKNEYSDRAWEAWKAASGLRFALGLFPGMGWLRRIKWLTKTLEVGDAGFDTAGDVINVGKGIKSMMHGDLLGGFFDTMAGLGGFEQDVDTFGKATGSKPLEGFIHKMLRKPGHVPATKTLAEIAGEGRGAAAMGEVEKGGSVFMRMAPGLESTLARFLPFLGTDAAATTVGAGAATAGVEAGGTLAASGGLIALFESNPVGWAITAVAAVAALAFGVYELYEHWGAVKAFFAKLWSDVCGYFSSAWARITGYVENLGPVKWLMAKWQTVAPYFQAIWSKVAAIFSWVRFFIIGASDYAVQGVQWVWGKITGFFQGLWNGVAQYAKQIWGSITGFFANVWSKIVGFFQRGGAHIWAIAQQIGQRAVTFLAGAWSNVAGVFKKVWDKIIAIFSAAWNVIKPIVDKLVGAVKWLMDSPVVQGVGNFFSGALHAAGQLAQHVEHHGEVVGQQHDREMAQRQLQQQHLVHQQMLQRHAASNPPRLPPPRSVARALPVHNAASVHPAVPVRVAAPTTQVARPFEPRGSSLERRERGYADIKVHFENTPPGTRVSTRTGGCCPPHVETGVAFGH